MKVPLFCDANFIETESKNTENHPAILRYLLFISFGFDLVKYCIQYSWVFCIFTIKSIFLIYYYYALFNVIEYKYIFPNINYILNNCKWLTYI
jgi:hypothetical protein